MKNSRKKFVKIQCENLFMSISKVTPITFQLWTRLNKRNFATI